MFENISKIGRAFHLRNVESKRERKNFEARQRSMFQEKLIQTKLEEQITTAVSIMQADETAQSIHIRIHKDALPMAEIVLTKLGLDFIACAEPSEFIIQRKSEVILG